MNYKDKIDYLKTIVDDNDLILYPDFKEALIGYEYSDTTCSAVYDVDKCIKILVNKNNMSEQEAYEYFDYNTIRTNEYFRSCKRNNVPVFIKLFNNLNKKQDIIIR